MKKTIRLKEPPLTQINWFTKRFIEPVNCFTPIDQFYLTNEVINACVGGGFITYDSNGSDDLSSKVYLELFGEYKIFTEYLLILLAFSLHDALDIEYYEVSNNIKIVIDEICKHPDTKEKYNELPTRRLFANPNLT